MVGGGHDIVRQYVTLTKLMLSRRTFPVFARVALSTSATDAAERIRVSPNFRRHVIFGANTDVGKTLVSTGLVRASLQNSSFVNYIKPLQCGGSDQAFVEKHISSNSNLHGQTLFSWETPASPHVASIKENLPKSDEEVLGALESALMDISKACLSQATTTTWIETAGGVLSPSCSLSLESIARPCLYKWMGMEYTSRFVSTVCQICARRVGWRWPTGWH